jgi:Tfp pilus assembly protein PilO
MKIISFILPFLFLGAAGLGAFVFVWPKYQDLRSVQAEVAEHRERIKAGEEVLESLRGTKQEIERRRENFQKIRVAVPEEVAVAGVYHEIQRMASSVGVKLNTISNTEDLVDKDASILVVQSVISLGLEGSYESAKNFVRQLKASARVLNIQDIVLESVSAEGEFGVLRITITIKAYGAS